MKKIVWVLIPALFFIAGCEKKYEARLMLLENKTEIAEGRMQALEDKLVIAEQGRSELKNLYGELVARTSQLASAKAQVSPSKAKQEALLTNMDIQMALTKAGCYSGSVSDTTGADVTQAIKDFQKANGLKVDGIAGSKTKKALALYLKR